MQNKKIIRAARARASIRKLSSESSLYLMIGEGVLTRVAQLLLRLGAARRALHTAIDARAERPRDRTSEFSGLAQKIFFDYPAILNEWYTNPLYTDSTGKPAKLSLHGRTKSFDALVHSIRPSNDPREALAVLARLRAVTKIGRTSVVARCRVLSTAGSRGFTAARMLSVVDAVLTTVEQNLDVGSHRRNSGKFYERAATNHRVETRYLKEFQRFLLEQGDDFLQTVDDWLSAHSVPVGDDKRFVKTCRVGTGVYMFASE